MMAAIGWGRADPVRGTAVPAAPARSTRVVASLLLGLALLLPGLTAPATPPFPRWKLDPGLLETFTGAPDAAVDVIVRETAAATDAAETLVRELGGRVTRDLSLIHGFGARVPVGALRDLARSPSIQRVWGDAAVRMNDTSGYDDDAPNTTWRHSIRLNQIETAYTGAGVTVAILDTGISRTPDLGDRVLARVDFTPEHDGFDRYGHGTHMAGIIAGNGEASAGTWRGVAPGADLLSLKVAGPDGSTDVSVVIAALQWTLANRDRYGIDILNLAFGTDSLQSYAVDPLNYAVERVWLGGIFVVVSAGNRGSGTLNKPGDDPFVVTVGAADLKDTVERGDDVIAPFSSSGTSPDGIAKPDLVAPGITIVASRAQGSTIEAQHPEALVGTRYMKGTGTSQAAAIVSGVAALMYEADPLMTPDVAKATLLGSTYKSPTYRSGGGAGLVDAAGAVLAARGGKFRFTPANVGLVPSTGLGSLHASRGSFRVYVDANGDGEPELVEGEVDVLGMPWSATSWSATSWSATSWGATSWPSLVCETSGWSATSWSGTSWSGTSWSATSWGATSWGATSWSANLWS